jgi:hypothetical protein
MRKTVLVALATVLVPACVFAVDGVMLINQSTVLAAGGFPYKITQPGSYKLSGNLQAKDQNTDVIAIASDNVTIDLNGFSITGTAVCSGSPLSCTNLGTGRGIATTSAVSTRQDYFAITIRNGVIQGMGFAGIWLSGDSFLIEYMHIRSNGESGIHTLRQVGPQLSAIIQHNNLKQNDRDGVSLYGGGAVTDNVCTENLLSGIAFLGAYSGFPSMGTAARNVLTNNGTYGFYVAGGPVSYIGNVIVGNTTGPIFGGINQGQNVCGNSACPGAVF